MIYLDNSATTKPCKSAVDAVMNMLTENFGNPSSTHFCGVNAFMALDKARIQVAKALGCEKEELYFTSGGTASDNTAIFGTVEHLKKRGNRIVTTALEHPAVSECMRRLENEGFEIIRLPADSEGHFTYEELCQAINAKTILVSVMAVNNELGTINNIKQIRKAVTATKSPAYIHVDAVQGFGKLNMKPSAMNVDLMSISSHKVHGPKGAGALYIRKGLKITPYLLGGGQEKGIISGTESLPAIVGFGQACQELLPVSKSLERMTALRDNFVDKLRMTEGIFINSPSDALPYIINISVPGIPSEVMVNFMSKNGICISAGSACKKGHRSDVLSVIGLPPERIDSAVRISLSTDNTAEELDILYEKIKEAMDRFIR